MEQFFLALIGFSGGFIVAGGVVALMVGQRSTSGEWRMRFCSAQPLVRLSQSFPFSFRSGRGCLQLQDCLWVSLWEAGSWRWQRS